MDLPDGVHGFPQTVTRNGTENTIHPAAVSTEKGLVLLDAGYASETDRLETNLTEAGFDWDDVSGIVLTHQDGDHAGATAAVVERTNATVFAHERAASFIDGRDHPIKAPEGERYPSATVDIELVEGVTFRTDAGPMDVIFTPGHAPGHLSLFFRDRGLLIAADALTADADGLAGPSERFTLDMSQALDSAERLASRAVRQVLCYHGGLVAADAADIQAVVDERR